MPHFNLLYAILQYLSANLSISLVYQDKIRELEEKLAHVTAENARLEQEIDVLKKRRFFDDFTKTN